MRLLARSILWSSFTDFVQSRQVNLLKDNEEIHYCKHLCIMLVKSVIHSAMSDSLCSCLLSNMCRLSSTFSL
jgi:hypothetical protein